MPVSRAIRLALDELAITRDPDQPIRVRASPMTELTRLSSGLARSQQLPGSTARPCKVGSLALKGLSGVVAVANDLVVMWLGTGAAKPPTRIFTEDLESHLRSIRLPSA